MVTAVEENEVLTDDELVAYPILLHVTGLKHLWRSGVGLTALHRHPDQLALLKADRDLIPYAVDELLRVTTPPDRPQHGSPCRALVGGLDRCGQS